MTTTHPSHDSIASDRAFKRAIDEWRAQDIHSVPPALMEKALKQARIERSKAAEEIFAALGARIRKSLSGMARKKAAGRKGHAPAAPVAPSVPRPLIFADR